MAGSANTPLRSPPPADTTRLFLARHGSTAANERQPFVLQGCEIDGPLTELGRMQSQLLGRALAEFPIHAVYSSSLRRARETAEAIAAHHGLTVHAIHDLRECSVGRWEGRDWASIQRDDPEGYARFFADPVHTPHPGGESYGDVLQRAKRVFDELFARHPGENIVVVGHNMLNRAYLAELVGVELRHARRLKQSNCCINLLQHRAGITELVTLNSVLHLDHLG
uniref:Histidine phosphatase family protein n=1 Tax=Schlesneria paludicola TaxID=360056 RepID=A0A7C4LL88_9PLAN